VPVTGRSGDALAERRGTAADPQAGDGRRRALSSAPIIRFGLLVSAVVAVVAVPLGTGLRGRAGAAAALLGVGIVVAFFVASKLAVGFVARRAPHLLLPAALGTYGAKIVFLGVLLVALDGVEAVNLPTLAWTVVAGVIGWIGAEVWVATHTRVPFFDPATFGANPPASAAPGDGNAVVGSSSRGVPAPGGRR